MCILFCYLQNDNIDIGYDLILLSNRDEYFQRPAKQAHVWNDTKYALGGSKSLALSFVTNQAIFFLLNSMS